MSLIIRAPGTIVNPIPGSIVPPDFGVSGVIMRHVPVADFRPGQSVPQVSDLVGGRPLVASGAQVVMQAINGVIGAAIAAGGQLTAPSTPYANGKRRSQALLVHLPAATGATVQVAGTLQAGTSLQACIASVGSPWRLGAYGDGEPYPRLAAAAGWRRVVSVFNDDGTGAIAIDGQIVRGAQAFTAAASTLFASIRSSAALPVAVADHAVFDHALSDAEIALVDAALASWLP